MASSAKEISDLAHGIDVHSSGNVGIGTASPQSILHIETSASDFLRLTSATGNNDTGIDFFKTTTRMWNIRNNGNNDYLYITPASTNDSDAVVAIKPDGDVGIGTISPADKVHIFNDSGTTVYKAEVNSNSTVGFGILKTGSTNQEWAIADGITHNGALQFYDGTNSAVRMHIDGSGRIGIGATGPVTGHKMTIKETATENASIVFTDTDDMVGAYVGMAKGNNEITTGTTNIDLVLGTAYTADTHLIANNAIGLTLKNGGNVGIGVTAPQFKLHVNKGSGNYAPTNGVVANIAGFQTNYNSAGSQILTYANLDGNWIDGTSGANSAFGWLWGYENNVRGGLVYDHRGSERMQMFSAYGALTFMTSDSAVGTAVPTDSGMNERLTILPGGNVGIGTTNPLVKLDLGVTSPNDQVIALRQNGVSRTTLGLTNNYGVRVAGPSDASGSGALFEVGQNNASDGTTYQNNRLTVLYDGKVGIGISGPNSLLHVNGGRLHHTDTANSSHGGASSTVYPITDVSIIGGKLRFSIQVFFQNGISNLAIRIYVAQTSLWFAGEVCIGSTYSSQQATGLNRYSFSHNQNTTNNYGNILNQTESFGQVPAQFQFASHGYDTTEGAHYFEFRHTASTGNTMWLQFEGVGSTPDHANLATWYYKHKTY